MVDIFFFLLKNERVHLPVRQYMSTIALIYWQMNFSGNTRLPCHILYFYLTYLKYSFCLSFLCSLCMYAYTQCRNTGHLKLLCDSAAAVMIQVCPVKGSEYLWKQVFWFVIGLDHFVSVFTLTLKGVFPLISI